MIKSKVGYLTPEKPPATFPRLMKSKSNNMIILAVNNIDGTLNGMIIHATCDFNIGVSDCWSPDKFEEFNGVVTLGNDNPTTKE